MSGEFARELRQNQTDAERRVWGWLRGRRFAGFKFRRQAPLGPYIVDFVCFQRKVILELDGGQHSEAVAYDARRTAYFERQGYEVVRVWNRQVFKEAEAVMRAIEFALDPRS